MYFKLTIILVLGMLLGTIEACSEKGSQVETDVVLKTQLDSVAYAIGMNLGAQLKNDSVMIKGEFLVAGLNDALYGDSTKLTEEDISSVMMSFQKDLQAKQQEKMMRETEENKTAGEKFLAENKSKPGVKITESGLQYIVLKEGTGVKPTAEDTVKVHYHGMTIDGKVFDSSVDRGEPITHPAAGFIPGWTEGLQLMKTGAKYKFFIPAELAYGVRGAPPQIGPNATLIFEVELLEVIGKK